MTTKIKVIAISLLSSICVISIYFLIQREFPIRSISNVNLTDSEIEHYIVEEVFNSGDDFYFVPKSKFSSQRISEILSELQKCRVESSDGLALNGYSFQLVSKKRDSESGTLWRIANSGDFILGDSVTYLKSDSQIKFFLDRPFEISTFYKSKEIHNKLKSSLMKCIQDPRQNR